MINIEYAFNLGMATGATVTVVIIILLGWINKKVSEKKRKNEKKPKQTISEIRDILSKEKGTGD